ncbi:hypothetical protein [Marinomonas lutimaris]|uniref:hypothetical protein n=1 Tax=Marinomonas lutimaris TaxID=2846746 RepID=UPI001CA49679|nr:hypothetical protein [Marinomonas lutimaris]
MTLPKQASGLVLILKVSGLSLVNSLLAGMGLQPLIAIILLTVFGSLHFIRLSVMVQRL